MMEGKGAEQRGRERMQNKEGGMYNKGGECGRSQYEM